MYLTIKVKSPSNISKWQMGFDPAFKGLMFCVQESLTTLGAGTSGVHKPASTGEILLQKF
jgi:hypothetical protein